MKHSAYTWAVIRAVQCRHCGEEAGKECRQPGGEKAPTHDIRYQDASAAGVKAP